MRINRPLLGCLISALVASLGSAQTIELVNNQPFDIRMPLTVRGVKLDVAGGTTVAQQAGDDAVVMVDLAASQSRKLDVNLGAGIQSQSPVTIKPDSDGVALAVNKHAMGRLAWAIVVDKPPTQKAEGDQAPSTKRDFAASFKPVELKFTQSQTGMLFDDWTATGTASGLKLDVTLRAYKTGFLDITYVVTNQSAPQKNVYAAVITRWEQPKADARTLCYDNRRLEFTDGAFSPFRAGLGRQQMIQRGVDWISTRFADGSGATWLNDFTPSFTVHREASVDSKKVKLGPRWVGANTAQLSQEAQAKGDAIYAVTEIARPNIKQYQSRLSENVLPGKDQPLSVTYRVAFDAKAVDDDTADNRFVGYVGFNEQTKTAHGAKVQFGVPFTKLGTNYFPYSTLGENFGDLRMPGMSKEGYWPLAAQTVLQYEKFADDIKRDLRTIKAMGFELVRLHHLEVLYDVDEKTGKPFIPEDKRWAYLDFLFKEIEALQFKALLDVKLPPAECAELVKRYGKLVDGVEYDNEVLIFQIFDEDVPVWKQVRDAVRAVDPNMPFHLTAHTNTGAFDRIEKLGATVDRVGQHTYMDGLDPIPSSRGYALAMANYAAKHGKEPLITEWNWRFMTRMPMEERAKVYAPIFENVLKTRCMPIMYQFQYQDSLAMNPSGLKGIRRYELLLLSRRPKPEAFEMMKLIERYGPPDSAVRKIGAAHKVVELTGDTTQFDFELTNNTDQPMSATVAIEAADGLNASLRDKPGIVLQPKQATHVPVRVALTKGRVPLPGFYHVFLRIEGKDGSLRYAWAEVRKHGNVTMDKKPSEAKAAVEYGPGAMDFNFDRPLTVVYTADEKSVVELEDAWTVFITLESATGRPVDIYQKSDFDKLADRDQRTIILVTRGAKGAKPSVNVEGDNKLVISGPNEKSVTAAAMDLVVRYWKNAKDAGARKVGLVNAPPAAAGGKTDLD
jgi:hypothetical protein